VLPLKLVKLLTSVTTVLLVPNPGQPKALPDKKSILSVRRPLTDPVAPVAPVAPLTPLVPFTPGVPCNPCGPVDPVSPLSPFSPRGPAPPRVADRSVFLQVDVARMTPVFLSMHIAITSPFKTGAVVVVGTGVSSAVAIPKPREPIKIPVNKAVAILLVSFFVMYAQ